VAKQENRIADALGDLEALQEGIEGLEQDAISRGKPVAQSRAWQHCIDSKNKIRRSIAEELTSSEVGKPVLLYTIAGVDMDKVFAPSEPRSVPDQSSTKPVPDPARVPGPEASLREVRDLEHSARDPEPVRDPAPAPEPEPVERSAREQRMAWGPRFI
jgi:hypothetical protein